MSLKCNKKDKHPMESTINMKSNELRVIIHSKKKKKNHYSQIKANEKNPTMKEEFKLPIMRCC